MHASSATHPATLRAPLAVGQAGRSPSSATLLRLPDGDTVSAASSWGTLLRAFWHEWLGLLALLFILAASERVRPFWTCLAPALPPRLLCRRACPPAAPAPFLPQPSVLRRSPPVLRRCPPEHLC